MNGGGKWGVGSVTRGCTTISRRKMDDDAVHRYCILLVVFYFCYESDGILLSLLSLAVSILSPLLALPLLWFISLVAVSP